jgi:hypothetical protein
VANASVGTDAQAITAAVIGHFSFELISIRSSNHRADGSAHFIVDCV